MDIEPEGGGETGTILSGMVKKAIANKISATKISRKPMRTMVRAAPMKKIRALVLKRPTLSPCAVTLKLLLREGGH